MAIMATNVPKSGDEETSLLSAERGASSKPISLNKGKAGKSKRRTLRTFEGAFAPVSLSMLSSIMFLRVGYILGNLGIWEALIQYVLAYMIIITTVLSICAIATNGAIEGGGVYFMLSRTLGKEFGGAIGILFWCANVVGSALFVAASTEGIVADFGPGGTLGDFLPGGFWWGYLYSTGINCINLFICLVGAKMFGRASSGIFLVVCACGLATMASFFSDSEYTYDYPYRLHECSLRGNYHNASSCKEYANGTFIGIAEITFAEMEKNLKDNWNPKLGFDCSTGSTQVTFFEVFAVLFSGITGVMSGANLSGELIKPSYSIPKGTLGAVFFTFCVFMTLSVLTALTCNPNIILHNCFFLATFSFWSPIISIGTFLATFACSLNNLIGATRILDAVATDRMFGSLLECITKGTFKENPIVAVIVTWIPVQAILLMGGFNKISQLNSVLFLMTYFSVNLACFELTLAAATNFRPNFKYYSWVTCLIGMGGTLFMMFGVSVYYALFTICLVLVLFFGLTFFSPIKDQNWGSIGQALIFHQVRKYLLKLDPRKAHVKFWRPQIILLVSNPRTACSLVTFVNALKKGGLFVIGHVYDDQMETTDKDPCISQEHNWLEYIDHLKVKAFVELTTDSSVRNGVKHLTRVAGLGALKPNTVIMGYVDNSNDLDDFTTPYSPFATHKFEGIFPALRQLQDTTDPDIFSPPRPTKEEFIGTIGDILRMEKNICLSRHFQHLNRKTLYGPNQERVLSVQPSNKLFLDVWLVNFISPADLDFDDITSHCLLQLASIVNIVPGWKKLKIRVFTGIESTSKSDTLAEKECQVKETLDALRIRADIFVIPIPQEDSEFPDLSVNYLASVCDLVVCRSHETAVSFLYLPEPPRLVRDYESYYNMLTAITENWPPTLLVRGASAVTSTTL